MLLLLSLLIGLVTLVWGYRLWLRARRYSTIPGNLGTPVFGNFYHFVKNYWHTWHPSYHKYMESNLDKYGDICCFWFCHEINIGLSDPYIVEKIAFHPSLPDKAYLVFDRVGHFMRNIFTFVPANKEWKLRRKELNNALKKSNLDSYHTTFINKAKKAVKLLSERSGEFDCMPETMLLPIEAIGETHFGMNLDIASNARLFKELHFTTTLVSAFMTNPILGYIFIAISEYIYFPGEEKKFEDMVCEKVLKDAKQIKKDEVPQEIGFDYAAPACRLFNVQEGSANFFPFVPKVSEMKNLPVSIIIALRHLLRKSKMKELKQELIELLYVGAHTIGVTIGSAFVYLATHPHIQEKVWNEQVDIFGDSDRDPTYDDLQKMENLERFYKEVLRFVAPPVTVKTATGDISVGEMIIPKGAVVTINSRRMRFDTRYWENPKEFNPDRFLEENISKVPKSAYGYFGYGIRMCPGYQYANYYVKVMLSMIVRNFKLRSSMKFEDIKYHTFVMMEMKEGFKISVEKRIRRMSTSS